MMFRYILTALVGLWPFAIQAQSPNQSLEIDVPAMTVIGKPPPKELVIAVPPLTIIGKPPPRELVYSVPPLVIIGKPEPRQMTIEVPEMVILGRPDCEDEPGGVACGEAQNQEVTGLAVDTGAVTVPAVPAAPGTADAGTAETASPRLWCSGAYSAHFSAGLATAQGVAVPVGQFNTAPATVKARDCGARMTVTIGGMPVNMKFDEEEKSYSGALNGMGDGVKRLLILTCDEDFQMRGQLVAQDPDLKIARAVWLIRKEDPQEMICN